MAVAVQPKLRGKAPVKGEKRLKALFYGPAGVGKTTAAIQFPSPYLIDTERGAENDQYVDLLNSVGGAYLFTTDADELIAEVAALLSTAHEYRTLIIDPLTIIYNDLIDRGMREKGEEYGRYKIPADRKIKHLLNLLVRLDMNVIITSHAKDKWVRSKDAKGKEIAFQEGYTFDCYPKLDYLFDLILEIGFRGLERIVSVRKSRITTLPVSGVFPLSYDEIANRYGREILERGAVSIAPATPEQVGELEFLVNERKDSDSIRERILKKCSADEFSELESSYAAACINALRSGKVGEA